MKVKQLVLLIVTFCIINTVCVFADDTVINVHSAVINVNKTITVTGDIENPVTNQQLVLMATDLLTEGYNKDGIFYINQLEPKLDKNNNFEISFDINKLLSEDNIYIVRLGGTNVYKPAQMIITTDNDDGEVLLGDVNLDGVITAADAALTLQNVLYHLDYLTQKQLDAMMVTKSEYITSDNAANILAKALDSMYVFPIKQVNV